jgi:hypothetical protein
LGGGQLKEADIKSITFPAKHGRLPFPLPRHFPTVPFGHPDALFGYPDALFGYPDAPFGYPDALFGYPDALFGYPDALFGYPDALFGYPDALFGHPDALFGYPDALFGHPDALFGYRRFAPCGLEFPLPATLAAQAREGIANGNASSGKVFPPLLMAPFWTNE